jgi:hypothetical protein
MLAIHNDGENEYRSAKLDISSIEESRRLKGSHKIDTDEADQVAETKETIPDPLRRIFTMWDV